LTEQVGDLFEIAENDACLAHCVSKDFQMSKGIAVLFKKKFGQVSELKCQGVQIGECGILPNDSTFIYYMVTKSRYYHKPTYDSVLKSLEHMRDHMVANSMTKLCIPRIGCGLDGLKWNGGVKELIEQTFCDTSIRVTVCRLE